MNLWNGNTSLSFNFDVVVKHVSRKHHRQNFVFNLKQFEESGYRIVKNFYALG